jgi:drug/metabolite transporter (DMT)-like permease
VKSADLNGRPPHRLVVWLSLAFIVVVWAVNFIAAKVGVRYLPPLTLASQRVTLAAIIMIPAYFICLRLPAYADAARAHRQGFNGRDVWRFVYLGFFGVIVNQVCFTIGLRYTSVSHAAIIVGMGPIYTLILAVLSRTEKATWRKVTGMAISFAGVALLAAESGIGRHSSSVLGDLITMTGSLGFAMYVVLGKRVASHYDSLTMGAFNYVAAALMLLPLTIRQTLAFGSFAKWRTLPWPGWAALVYMAIFSSALAYLVYFWLLKYLEATQLSALIYLMPVLAALLGIVWLGERGSWMQVVGGVLALAGVYWVEAGRRVSPLSD